MTRRPVLSIDLGGTGIKGEVLLAGGATDGEPSPVLASARVDTPRGPAEEVLAEVVRLGRALLDRVSPDQRPSAAGVAVPGLLDPVAGVGRFSANLGWRDAPVARIIAPGLGLPVTLVHDVAAAGLAEHRLGAGRGLDDVVVVVIGTGVAASVVAAGRVVTGGIGQAGELGHLMAVPGGPPCGCGRSGCVEALASAGAIARRYTDATGIAVSGALDVVHRLGSDMEADRVWAEALSALADALLATCALLAPSRIVVGGGLAGAGQALLGPLRTILRERATVEAVPAVVPATLGGRAGIEGAALASIDPSLVHSAVHLP